jgi:beta-galactosidase
MTCLTLSHLPARRIRAVAQVLLAATLLLPAACAQPGNQTPTPATSTGATSASSPRQRVNFDADWRFIKGDPADAGDTLSYDNLQPALLANSNFADYVVRPTANITPGENVSYVKPDFDDSTWRQLNLPHDWGIEGPFDMKLAGATGRLPYFGIGWYRKTFTVPPDDAGKRVFLDVDGAMSYASVWLNGHYLGGWPYGYTSFQVDLTPFLKPGAGNVIAIRLDNPNSSSRWYPGGGIYRNVWLETMNPLHVTHSGTFVTTPEISATNATVNIKVDVSNENFTPANATVKTDIYALNPQGDITGPVLASATSDNLSIGPGAINSTALNLQVANPQLWDLQHPNLYTAVTTIQQDGQDVDSYRSNFGIRTIKFDPNGGFFLNGQHLKLNGVCDHADLGPLGSVVNVRGLERQIQLLKEMGCNAIRTSHNMPAPELLDLCDRLGMLVMDESFDCWDRQKVANDYHLLWPDWHTADERSQIRRDRNHPSVILYSVGNEIPDQGSENGNAILNELVKTVHAEDPTRLVLTNNSSNNGFTSYPEGEYAFGFSYEPQRNPDYTSYHEQHPDVVLLGSESASTISARGVYVFPVTSGKGGGAAPNHMMSSYDLYAPRWANIPDVEFTAQDKNPFAAGEFVWTGFDYLGEPTNNGPRAGAPDTSRSSYFGIFDLDGFKKDRFYLYQAHWRPDLPMAHILPHWNWPGREGQVTPVMVYTSGDEAELFVNGVSQGRKTKGQYEYRLRWDDVVYQPGELHVVAYKNGQVWAEDTVKTTGDAAQVALTPDRATITNDGRDISYVTVSIKDKDGLTVPTAMNPLHFDISGPGEIVAVDNGDETSLAPIQGTKDSKAFNGLALVIVRAKPGQSGPITLTATSDGLQSASVPITAAPAS